MHPSAIPSRATPVVLKVLIHCYVYSKEEVPDLGVPSVQGAIEFLLRSEMIAETGKPYVYRVTARGTVWMESILLTPFPQRAWASADGNVVRVDNTSLAADA